MTKKGIELLKAEENPPIFWPETQSICDCTGLWWVAHTKSRNEKALAHDLVNREISYFLPMTWNIRRHRGRKIQSLLPLFSGYVFFCGNENQRLEVLRTNRVANIIEVKDQDRLVNELAQIDQALRAGADLTPHKYMAKGQLCRVITGPLEDLEGIVVTTKGAMRLILQIDMLGQAASVEVDTNMVEAVDSP